MAATVDVPTDAEFLAAQSFEGAAPTKLVVAAEAGDVATFVKRLRKWLPEPVTRDDRWVSWSTIDDDATSRTRELFDVLRGLPGSAPSGKSTKAKLVEGVFRDSTPGPLAAWLDGVTGDQPLTEIERVLLAEVLFDYGGQLSRGDLWGTWRALVEADDVSSDDVTEVGPCDQLAENELDWVRATITFDDDARRLAVEEFERFLDDGTDTDGTPTAEIAANLGSWLAPYVRITEWSNALETSFLSSDSTERLHQLAGFAIATLRSDGTLPFGRHELGELLSEAADLFGWTKKSTAGSLAAAVSAGVAARSQGKKKRPKQRTPKGTDEPPGRQSDWAHLGHLRSDWTTEGDSLLALHDGPEVAIDLAVFGHTLLSGPWSLSLQLDGEPVDIEDRWTCVCWFSDDEVDYLELQHTIDEETRIERQLLLPRGDRFAILADIVTARDGVRIDYESRLPVAEGLEMRADVETRECRIHAIEQFARVLPLALPQDRVESAIGWFGPDEDVLRLEQSGVGGLYAPVVFDWALDRSTALADWRTVTVAEAGRRLGTDAAAAARCRVGNEQLLLYRSIRPGSVARTVLGLHTPRETVIGRVPESGEIDTLLLVDA